MADRLAAQSESIAAAWEAGDTCGAAKQADDLKHATDDAIRAGDIPAAYQDELESAVGLSLNRPPRRDANQLRRSNS